MQYLSDIENKIKNNVKSFWSYVHRFEKGNAFPQQMHLRDRSAFCRRIICNWLAEHFCSVFSNESFELPQEKQVFEMLISLKIDEQKLLAALLLLDDDVKSGPDSIPPEILAYFYIFPIYKDKDKVDVTNYRHISILSTFAKIFELIMAKRLSDFCFRAIGLFTA